MIEFIDKTEESPGTPINRSTLMGIQGFTSGTTTFNDDGSIVEINSKGQALTTVFNDDGSITEVFTGEKTIRKTTFFDENEIREVMS